MAEFRVEAMLFDLDGTLVDSTASVHRNWRKVAALLDRPGEDLVGELHGMPGRQVLRLREPQLSADRIEELNQILIDGETGDTADVVPTPGALAVLAALPDNRWAIVTSGPHRLATARIRAAGLPTPVALITADDVTIGKPDPEPFRLGAAALGIEPGRCLVIEDAPAGITAGRDAGCQVLGLRTTYPELDACTVADLASVSVQSGPDGLLVRF